MEKYGRARHATDDNIIQHIHCFACWLTEATEARGICNSYCFGTETMVTRMRLNVVLYACLV